MTRPPPTAAAPRAVARAIAPAIPSSTRPRRWSVESRQLARLHARLATALGGQRQLVFVTGEPGIGKTALVEAFLAEVGETHALRIGRGQCVEQYGAGEAYLPVLEALGRLGRGPGGERLVQVLKQHAPTWLAQLPALLADADLEAVQRRAQGATRERMLRELVEALDTLAPTRRSSCVLEDLHWSDSVHHRPAGACWPGGAKPRACWWSGPTGPPTWRPPRIRLSRSSTSCSCTGTARRSRSSS